ncbi:MAG: radical SAM family heme chaperone HemW [Sulfurimonas sp.]
MLLYIHIPFCDSKCHYCAFNTYVDKFHLKASYMEALKLQLIYELKDVKKLESVFIGGGTPSCVEASLYKNIFELLKPHLDEQTEITTEANPNSATKEWLEAMLRFGVNRVSFGVQSFDKQKLKLLNRAHTKDDALKAIQNAHSVGFKNISLDLIYAISTDTKELLKNDLDIAFSLPINHISAYALIIEEGSVFQNKPHLSSEKLSLTKWFFNQIISRGFKHYEIGSFGTYECIHNKGYWELKEYIGAGAGAVGMRGAKRYYPKKVIEEYIQNPLHKDFESLSEDDIKLEKIFLAMRSSIGLDETILSKKELERARLLTSEGKLEHKNSKFYNLDFLLADEIALFIS